MDTDLMKESHISAICEKLKEDDFKFKEQKFDYLDVLLAIGAQFNMSWLKTTQINIFAFMGIVEKVSMEFAVAYSRMTLSYAMKNHKDFPKHMNNITASFPLLISSCIDDDAKQWIQQKPKNQLGFIEMPVILDTDNNTLLFCNESTRRSGNKKFLAALIQKYFNTTNT
ncbi:MAG: hypothetical protein K8F52_17740 [Candidatus Scalindua rubra]|uniref:Uncharacterized protein n=1 Tax=Candidatus Scalindua brodae TaxID=237368 RepID=A0A0B0EJZ1_9BACT|nr:MAG: hypothetical protein SCABRO_01268 [Candidatus Scalindua brodae]MBZ0110498.1 hypothetical protein [Candidatus Scalindua rubra]TWU36334.1 hypothetical protein S225a_06130 [Candidatus Brocadiaceae bacterium S225]